MREESYKFLTHNCKAPSPRFLIPNIIINHVLHVWCRETHTLLAERRSHSSWAVQDKVLLLGGDSFFIGILMESPARIVAQNFLAQFRILRCFLNLQKQLGEHPSLTNKSDLTIRRIERVLNENAMIMLNSIYRVSHI